MPLPSKIKEKISIEVIKIMVATFDFISNKIEKSPFPEAFLNAFSDKLAGKVSDIPKYSTAGCTIPDGFVPRHDALGFCLCVLCKDVLLFTYFLIHSFTPLFSCLLVHLSTRSPVHSFAHPLLSNIKP